MRSVSVKDRKFAALAAEEAINSPVMMRIGCVAVLNGKPIARGFNHYRSHSRDKIITNTFTCHAECHVLHQLKSMYGHNPRKLSKVVQAGSVLYC